MTEHDGCKAEKPGPRPVTLQLTMPGPVCGCPLEIGLSTQAMRPEHPIPAVNEHDLWLFSPDQLKELMDALTGAVMTAYAHALEARTNELERAIGEEPEPEDAPEPAPAGTRLH